MRVFPRADGFKSFFVVPSRPASNTFGLRIDAPGLTLVEDGEEEITMLDGAGNVVGRIPRPFMLGSAESTPSRARTRAMVSNVPERQPANGRSVSRGRDARLEARCLIGGDR